MTDYLKSPDQDAFLRLLSKSLQNMTDTANQIPSSMFAPPAIRPFVSNKANNALGDTFIKPTQTLAEDASYGMPLHSGTGMTYRPDPRFIDAAALVDPMLRPAGLAVKATGKMTMEQLLKQLRSGEGMVGKLGDVLDPNMYAVPKRTSAPPSSGFERKFVGKQVENKIPNFDQMIGGSLFTFPSDSTSRGYLINKISGIPIDPKYQKVTEGGFMFGKDKDLADKGIAYASNLSAASGQLKRAKLEAEKNIARGGTGKIFVAPSTMASGAENFSTQPTEQLFGLANSQGMTRNNLAIIDDMVRNTTVKGKQPYKNWVGMADSGALEQLKTGEGIDAGATALRKLVKEKYESVTGQKTLNYNASDLTNALLDPKLANAPKHNLGDVWYQLDLEKGIRPSAEGSGHRSYSHDFMGQFVGSTPLKPTKDVFGNVYSNIENTIPKIDKTGRTIPEATRQLNTIHSLRDLHDNSSLFLDEANIKRLKELFGVK
jgi:hypothetical protein